MVDQTLPTAPLPLRLPDFEQPVPDENSLGWKLGGGWPVLIVAVVLLMIAIVLMLVVAFNLLRDYQYRTQGDTTEGTIIGKRVSTSSSRRGGTTTNHFLTYRFSTAQGRELQEEERVSSDFYSAAKRGDARAVQFLPSDPSINRLLRERGNSPNWIMGAIATALLLFSYLVLFGSRKAGRRRANVIFHGEPRPGQVVLAEERGRGKSRRYVIVYRYVGLDGQEKVSDEVNVNVKVMKRFPQGTILTILVDPNDPKRRPEPDLYGVRPLPQL